MLQYLVAALTISITSYYTTYLRLITSSGNRTRIFKLEVWHINLYTILAILPHQPPLLLLPFYPLFYHLSPIHITTFITSTLSPYFTHYSHHYHSLIPLFISCHSHTFTLLISDPQLYDLFITYFILPISAYIFTYVLRYTLPTFNISYLR